MNVLKAAREIDRSALEFYREMAEHTRHPGVRRIFRRLAEDEQGLLENLNRLEESLPHIALRDSPALDPAGNVFERLRAKREELHVNDDIAAYALAREAEEEVVRLIETAITHENRPEIRSLLKRILTAEQRELDEIESLHDFANAPNQHLAWGEFSNLEEFHNFGRDV